MIILQILTFIPSTENCEVNYKKFIKIYKHVRTPEA